MKIRLMGTVAEVNDAVHLLRQVFNVEQVSRPYPNRNAPGVRVYVEATTKESK